MKTINIKAKFGSKIQEKIAMKAITGLLETWSIYFNNLHKKNDIRYTIVK